MTIHLQLDTLRVTAEVEHGHATITRVTDAQGHTASVSDDDLDRIEAAIFSEETVTDLGRFGQFTVIHRGESIFAIRDAHGYQLDRSSELFTEVAECFHIDRHWQMMEESDVQGHARRCYC